MVSVRLFPNWRNFVQGELQEFVLHGACWSHCNWFGIWLRILPILASPIEVNTKRFLMLSQLDALRKSLQPVLSPSMFWDLAGIHTTDSYHIDLGITSFSAWRARDANIVQPWARVASRVPWPNSADSTSQLLNSSQISKTLRALSLGPRFLP